MVDRDPCGCTDRGTLSAQDLQGNARALLHRGEDAAASGDSQRGILLLDEAARRAGADGENSLMVEATLASSSAFMSANQSRQAVAPLTALLTRPGITRAQSERVRLALVDCLLRSGRPRQASQALHETNYADVPGGSLMAAVLDARLRLQTKDAAGALETLLKARTAATVEPAIYPEFLMLLATVEAESGHYSEAQAAVDILAGQLNPVTTQNLRYVISALQLLSALVDEPGFHLPEAFSELSLRQLEQTHDPATRSLVYGYLGQIAERQGHPADALAWTRRALMQSSTNLQPGLEMLWNWQLARIAQQAGDVREADGRYAASLKLAAVLRSTDAFSVELPDFFHRERVQDLFRDAADFLLLHGPDVRPSAQAAWREAIAIMNARRESRVRDFFQDQCLAALRSREKPVESIAPGAAVLHVLALPGRVEVLLQVKQQIFRHVVDVPEQQLNRVAEEFRDALTNRLSNRYRSSGKQLYDWLIRPFDQNLSDMHIDTLVVAADGTLQLIPFAALYDGKDFLIQRMAVATTPSLRLLDAGPSRTGDLRVLGCGLEQGTQGFPPLLSAGSELGVLRNSLHARIVVDQDFTQGTFQDVLARQSISVVHVVSHAEVGPDPEDFFILTYDGRITLDDLDRDIRPVLYRREPLELLVLSACSTASGDDRVALGLAGVALKAGARSTIASLWSINDQSSAQVMQVFYDKWLGAGSLSKAQALRAAQLSLLHDSRYRHPALWAPYILIGNWQ